MVGPAGDLILSPGFLNIPQSHAGLLLFDKFQTWRTYEILATYTDNSKKLNLLRHHKEVWKQS